MRFLLAIAVFAVTCPLLAQERVVPPRFRAALGFAGGELDHRTDGSPLDGDADAGLFRLQFEGTTPRGIGGGIRFEAIQSDDDLFRDAGFVDTEASWSSLFAHFTYRLEARRFTMPMRIGLILNGYTLEEENSDDEIVYGSIGPYFELAPEIRLVGRRSFGWSLYGEVGLGAAVTGIEIEDDRNDYISDTAFFGVELGTRLHLGRFEVGAAYVGRWQSMDESDEEDGLVVFGYDADFQGLMVTFGAVF
jgi:hypothetical protein